MGAYYQCSPNQLFSRHPRLYSFRALGQPMLGLPNSITSYHKSHKYTT